MTSIFAKEDIFAPLPVTLSVLPVPTKCKSHPEQEIKKPKRPLSAYNIFFQMERERILESLPSAEGTVKSKGKKKKAHGKISFTELGRVISKRWKTIDLETRIEVADRANKDKLRYINEMDDYKRRLRDAQAQKKGSEKVCKSETDFLSALDHGIPQLAEKLDHEMKEMIIAAFL